MATILEEEMLTQTEIARVASNWIEQPGTEFFDLFLAAQGVALQIAVEKRAVKIKQAFPLEWRGWNVKLDECGNALLREGE